MYEYSYELVPAKVITFRLRAFAPWFLRVFIKKLKTSAVSTTYWIVETNQLCKLRLKNEVWQGCASWQCKTTHCWSFWWFFFLLQMHFTILSVFLGDFDPPWWTQYIYFEVYMRSKKTSQWWLGLYCNEAQPCQMSLFNSQKPRCKNDSRAEFFFSLGFSESPIHCW